ncbi:unnamed protein product, partial [Boreogadus saida]
NSKSAQGLVGLRNLGNTCFMNSILQCLSNTHSLRDYCLHNSHRRDLNNNSRTNTALMEEFAKLLQTMWMSSNSDAVSPSEFKTQIQRYAPRFVGYKQYRYTAYRQAIHWAYGISGRSIRKPLPSCVVSTIGQQFQSGDHTYQVFQWPRLDENE